MTPWGSALYFPLFSITHVTHVYPISAILRTCCTLSADPKKALISRSCDPSQYRAALGISVQISMRMIMQTCWCMVRITMLKYLAQRDLRMGQAISGSVDCAARSGADRMKARNTTYTLFQFFFFKSLYRSCFHIWKVIRNWDCTRGWLIQKQDTLFFIRSINYKN